MKSKIISFILLFLTCISMPSFAQGEEKAFEVQNDVEQQEDGKNSAAYKVLGRELTTREKEVLGIPGEIAIKEQLLYREQRLVIVRALLALGEPQIATRVLEVWDTSKPQTFTQLVEMFQGYKEKYGSVKEAIQAELISNIKDAEQAYKKAAIRAYETVFCITPQDPDIQQIVSYLKENEALTFSQMIKKLMDSLTPEDKKDMLFKTLDKVGRPDLKTNSAFIEKLLSQEFHCENLTALLQELTPAKKQGTKPQSKPSKSAKDTKKPNNKK